MKRIIYLLVLILFPSLLFAQKNVIPVSKTQLLNLKLPEGSKQDKRFLSVTSATLLLDMEAKKESKSVLSTEVYYLPPATESGYNAELLVQALGDAGYQIYGVEGDDKFAWAENNSQSFIFYFETNLKQTDLYIGNFQEAANPVTTASESVNSNVVEQPLNNLVDIPPLKGRQTGSAQVQPMIMEELDFVYDLDGNRYNVMKIGENFWLKENLRTTQYNDTTYISKVTDPQEWSKIKHGAYAVYDNNPGNIAKYGLLYNGYAAASGKLCPDGWHVASDAEWKQLELSYGVPESELDRTGERGDIAGKLKVVDGWNPSAFSGNNSSGFSIVPAGSRIDNGEFNTLNQYGNFWTSTVYDDRYGLLYLWNHHVHYNTNAVGRIYTVAQNGYSCRCVKDKPKPAKNQ